MCNCVDCHIVIQTKYSFYFCISQTQRTKMKCVRWCSKAKTFKKETKEEFGFRVQEYKANWFLHTQHDILILGHNQSPSLSLLSLHNQNMMTLESPKCHTGSSSTCLFTDLTLPVTSLDTSTANIDSSYFTIHFEAEIIAENESLIDHRDVKVFGEIIISVKNEVNYNVTNDPGLWLDFSAEWLMGLFMDSVTVHTECEIGHLTSLTNIAVVINQWGIVQSNFLLEQKPMVRNARESGYCIHHQQDQFLFLFVCYCFVCKLLAPKHFLNFVMKEGFRHWQNNIVNDNHEKSTIHWYSFLSHLTCRQGAGLKHSWRNISRKSAVTGNMSWGVL